MNIPYEFYKRYFKANNIKRLIYEQFEDSDFCVGSGPALINMGWSKAFPVHAVPHDDNPAKYWFNHPINSLDQLFYLGLDLFKPLREKQDKFLYITWDIEYFNREDYSFLYKEYGENQKWIFAQMAPVFEYISSLLNSYGIRYLIDVTASGIHIWSKISTDARVFKEFAREGYLEESLIEKYNKVVAGDIKRQYPLPLSYGRAYNTAGKLIEYLTHKVIRAGKRITPLPVTISDSSQGGETFAHSGISSDITQYAHPIYMRVLRLIGSMHQKVNMKFFEGAYPAIDILKVPGISYSEILNIMWNPDVADEYFADKSGKVPVSDEGWLNLLNEYCTSTLRKWHKTFESLPERVQKTYSIKDHPPCIIANILSDNPRHAFLTPTNLQFIAEYMYEKGENLRAISRMVGELYSDPAYNWFDKNTHAGIDFEKYDAFTAANFWFRVYTGLYKEGLGRGLDCQKIKRAGLCQLRNCYYKIL